VERGVKPFFRLLGRAAAVLLPGWPELGARWWLRRRGRYYVWPPGLRLQLNLDRAALPELESPVRFEINRDGERGSDVPTAEKNLYRVLVAGGSPVEGLFLDQCSSWPGALQRRLETPESLRILGASRVHVGNIGRSGVASPALDLIFERVLPRYRRLNAIVIMVGGNDVFQWLENGAPPSLRPRPLPASWVFSWHPEGPFGWRLSELALVELLRRLRQRVLSGVEVRDRAGKWVEKARAMRARAKTIDRMPDPTAMLNHFDDHFRKLLLKARAGADRVLVVRQPWFEKDYSHDERAHLWHGGVGKPWREEVTTYYSIEVVCRLMGLMDQRAARVADELGIEQLDLMPILEPSLETYYDFVHFTSTGAAAVAAAVAAALLRGAASVIEQSGRRYGHDSRRGRVAGPVDEEAQDTAVQRLSSDRGNFVRTGRV
jgi:lysophospholipase L1-like esterase